MFDSLHTRVHPTSAGDPIPPRVLCGEESRWYVENLDVSASGYLCEAHHKTTSRLEINLD